MKVLSLGLMPHIDILSVMVAFLLVYSTDVEVLQNPNGVSIPQSRTDTRPKQSVVVMVTKNAVLVQGEMVASLAEVSDPHTQLVEPLRKVLATCTAAAYGKIALAVMQKEEPVSGVKS